MSAIQVLVPRVTRKGAFLVANGILYAGYGYSLDTIVSQPDRQIPFSLAIEVMPLQTWAYLWGVVGAITILAGVFRCQVPLAFAAIMTLSTVWVINFLLAQPLYEAPSRTWVGGLLFGSLVAGIGIVAGWPEVKK